MATDLHAAGGVAVMTRELTKARPRRTDARNVDGRTPRRDRGAADGDPRPGGILPIDRPLSPTGGLAILRGNLAPEGSVVKLAGHERRLHTGPARVFDREEDAFAAVKSRSIVRATSCVIRNEGPAGGPGMREMLHVTAALVGRGAGRGGRPDHRRPLLRRDARLHGRPRRPRGVPGRPDRGPARTATRSTLDVEARELRVELSDDEIAARLADWSPPPPRYTRGVLAKYASLVSSASEGAVTRPM